MVSGGHEEQLRRWAELALDQQESAERAVRGVVENEPDIIRNGLEMGGFSGCAFCAHKVFQRLLAADLRSKQQPGGYGLAGGGEGS